MIDIWRFFGFTSERLDKVTFQKSVLKSFYQLFMTVMYLESDDRIRAADWILKMHYNNNIFFLYWVGSRILKLSDMDGEGSKLSKKWIRYKWGTCRVQTHTLPKFIISLLQLECFLDRTQRASNYEDLYLWTLSIAVHTRHARMKNKLETIQNFCHIGLTTFALDLRK